MASRAHKAGRAKQIGTRAHKPIGTKNGQAYGPPKTGCGADGHGAGQPAQEEPRCFAKATKAGKQQSRRTACQEARIAYAPHCYRRRSGFANRILGVRCHHRFSHIALATRDSALMVNVGPDLHILPSHPQRFCRGFCFPFRRRSVPCGLAQQRPAHTARSPAHTATPRRTTTGI